MQQLNLFFDRSRLFDHLCDMDYLRAGFKAVKKNKGAPGIDGITIEVFDSRLEEELDQLQKELRSWSYEPQPVKRVDIPKPGKKDDFRKLGIPAVLPPAIDADLVKRKRGILPGASR